MLFKTALPKLANMQRRMSITIREYKFFRSFSQKFENWPKRKAEALWRKMRERKIAGEQKLAFADHQVNALTQIKGLKWIAFKVNIPI